ncbi:MAG TPA: AP2/ERF family transcription factor [Scandinavium sp.]|jgi:hypothetical protein|uniref:AP2/ERF family transcription factor n=1 Tax=Scandinavium sp. TaxID=2830653 RepID=UPI002E2F008A|nr:AP2/ERF family transcription factor [Scandinavium sp.]HEX4501069.1 AP2/ERF family transcription factor [Scandinavium sp.]
MPKRRVKRPSVTQPSDPFYRYIPLTRGKIAIIDTEDFVRLSQWNWRVTVNSCDFYAVRNGKNKKNVYMHRQIIGCKPKEHADHKNHDTLDNRKNNIRKCTRTQNMCNRKAQINCKSGFKGVVWRPTSKKWSAGINYESRHIALGCFNTKEEAARAYDVAAKFYQGEFAHLNFPI